MSVQIRHEVLIDAPAEKVWALIVDMPHWHTWSSLVSVEVSEVKAGVAATLRPVIDGKAQTAAVTLREVDADKLILRWGGGLGPLLQADHWLRLERRGSDRCCLFHGENITGLLPFLNVGMPYAKLDRAYKLINDALKAKAEGRATGGAK